MSRAKRVKAQGDSRDERRAAIKKAVTALEKASGEAMLNAMVVIEATADDAGVEVNPPDLVFGCDDPVVARLRQIAIELDRAATVIKKEA